MFHHHWWMWLILVGWIVIGLRVSYEKLKNDEIVKHAQTMNEIRLLEKQNEWLDIRNRWLAKGKSPWTK